MKKTITTKLKKFFILSVLTVLVAAPPVHGTNTSTASDSTNSNSFLSRLSNNIVFPLIFLSFSSRFASIFGTLSSCDAQVQSSLNYFGKPSIFSTVLDYSFALQLFQGVGISLDILTGYHAGKWLGKKMGNNFGEKVGAIVGAGAVAGIHLATKMSPWTLPISTAIRSALLVSDYLYSKFITSTEQKKGTKKNELEKSKKEPLCNGRMCKLDTNHSN